MKSMIKKSFPELEKRKIFLFEFNLKKYHGGSIKLPFFDIVVISTNLKNKIKIQGVLAHELCHLERFKKKGWLKYAFEGAFYWIIPSFRINEDRNTDKSAIEKGYARNLYSLKKNKKKNKYYLSAEEIKEYARKIGKW